MDTTPARPGSAAAVEQLCREIDAVLAGVSVPALRCECGHTTPADLSPLLTARLRRGHCLSQECARCRQLTDHRLVEVAP